MNENFVTVMSRHYDDRDDPGDCFWVEDPLALLTDFTLIPRAKMSLEQKMNIITRIVIVVWILLLVIKYRHATVFFLATLLVIVLIYYSRKRHEDRISRIIAKLSNSTDRYTARSENLSKSIDNDEGFTRFEAMAGNKMPQPVKAEEPSTRFVEKNRDDQNLLEEHQKLQELLKLKKTMKRQEKIAKREKKAMRKKNQEEMVTAQQPAKRDPRRPWPPTVPFSMEVKSGHGGISQEAAHVPQPHNKANDKHFDDKNRNAPPSIERKPAQHNTYEGKRDVKSSNRQSETDLEEQRKLNLRRSHLGGPHADSKFHGYHVEAFQDESGEESDSQSESERNNYRQEVQSAPAVIDEKPAVAKRTFLPSNYDISQDKTAPVKNDNPKMTRHGAARARRVPKWGDDNEVKAMQDASEMQFARAAKMEESLDTKGRSHRERKSQVRSLFG